MPISLHCRVFPAPTHRIQLISSLSAAFLSCIKERRPSLKPCGTQVPRGHVLCSGLDWGGYFKHPYIVHELRAKECPTDEQSPDVIADRDRQTVVTVGAGATRAAQWKGAFKTMRRELMSLRRTGGRESGHMGRRFLPHLHSRYSCLAL